MKERDFMLERYEKVKEYVYSQYAKIYNEELKVAALTHTASVDLSITFIAMARGTNLERAKVAALFHTLNLLTTAHILNMPNYQVFTPIST